MEPGIDLNGLLVSGEKVVLGFSGGADSSALFHMLVNSGLNLRIFPVHVNHGLRGEEAERDGLFCVRTAERYGFPCAVYRADIRQIARERGISVEEAGREFRYAAFNETAEKTGAKKILTAHNKDDNAETILMRLLRGTGPAGLAGIPFRRGNIIRPLLYTNRTEILHYLNENNVPFLVDSTNEGTDYTRNKIRNFYLPKIREEINPRVADGLTAFCEIFAMEDKFLNKLAGELFDGILKEGEEDAVTLCLTGLRQAEEAMQRRVIRLSYERLTGKMRDLSNGHVKSVLKLLFAERGKVIELPGGFAARAGKNVLVFERNKFVKM